MFTKKIKSLVKNFLLTHRSYKFFIKDWSGSPDIFSAQNIINLMRHAKVIKPEVIEKINYQSILIIAPHPDDEIIGAGGAIINCLESSGTVHVYYLTKGSLKDVEAGNCAKLLGYTQYFMDNYSNNISLNVDTIDEFSNYINTLNPDIIYMPFLLDDHDDHRLASHLFYYSYKLGKLNWSGEIWAYQVYSVVPANFYLDITEIIHKKCDLIFCFKSQLKHRDWANYIKGLHAFNSRFSTNIDQKYLESYFVTQSKDYFELCALYFDSRSGCYQNESYNKFLNQKYVYESV